MLRLNFKLSANSISHNLNLVLENMDTGEYQIIKQGRADETKSITR